MVPAELSWEGWYGASYLHTFAGIAVVEAGDESGYSHWPKTSTPLFGSSSM